MGRRRLACRYSPVIIVLLYFVNMEKLPPPPLPLEREITALHLYKGNGRPSYCILWHKRVA